MRAVIWFLILVAFAYASFAKIATISNSKLRLDVDGNVIDCHSGNIVYHDGTYFMYGERYGNSTGFGEKNLPRIHVYTSTDMMNWTHHGEIMPDAPVGTYFTPYGVFNPNTNNFVLWFNAYTNGCCAGSFGVATSLNGIIFKLNSLSEKPVYDDVDCNGLFIDDDGTGYVIYSSIPQNHRVSIEKLTPDMLHTTRENYGFFEDGFVEGSVLFKRNGIYYVSYGSCCCWCRAGGGVVFWTATNITGPWKRMGTDHNCNTTTEAVCGNFGDRITKDQIVIQAQGIGLSLLPGPNGMNYLWHGERWMSAPNNNPQCPHECQPSTGVCTEPSSYIKGHGYSYWMPLEFNPDGSIQKFTSFVDSIQLQLV